MRFRPVASVALLAAALAAPAHAGDRPDPFAQLDAMLSSGALFQGVVREEDLSALFAHLRAVLLASYQGREAPSSEELDRRMEAIAAEMKARGTVAGLALIAALEAAARQAVRDAAPVPAPR